MVARQTRFAFLLLTLLSGAAQASSDDIAALLESQERMQRQIEALTARVAQLESANATLIGRNPPSAAEPPASAAPARAPAHERFKWNGDFRLRHDRSEPADGPSRDRERIQAHFGFEAALTDDVAAGLQLATGGDDPRAANQTLTGEFSRKPIALDLAYLRWSPAPGIAVTGGKMKYPVYKPASSRLYDSDVNPEGLAVSVARSNVFANLYAFSVEERAAAADTTLAGAQAGAKWTLGGAGSVTAAVGYSDLGAGVGRRPFFGLLSNGNTVNADGTLAFDFRVTQASVEYARTLGRLPFVAFAEAARNSAAPEDLDTAYGIGFVIGKARAPRSWEAAWLYQHVEKDAWFGQLTDSDFGGGLTDAEGSVFRFAYAPIANGTLTATYYLNDLALTDPLSPDSTDEYQRLQLDFTMRF
jgi:hypothetical protein